LFLHFFEQIFTRRYSTPTRIKTPFPSNQEARTLTPPPYLLSPTPHWTSFFFPSIPLTNRSAEQVVDAYFSSPLPSLSVHRPPRFQMSSLLNCRLKCGVCRIRVYFLFLSYSSLFSLFLLVPPSSRFGLNPGPAGFLKFPSRNLPNKVYSTLSNDNPFALDLIIIPREDFFRARMLFSVAFSGVLKVACFVMWILNL